MNIDDNEIKKKAKVTWHPDEICFHCGGRMFWEDVWKRWICESWLYMEGGCLPDNKEEEEL